MKFKHSFDRALKGDGFFKIMKHEISSRRRKWDAERINEWYERIRSISYTLIKFFALYMIFYKGMLGRVGFEKTAILLMLIVILIARGIARGQQ